MNEVAHFVYHRHAFYYARVPQDGPDPALGRRVGIITCTVAGTVTSEDPVAPAEGSAGFVAVGTAIFALRACPETVAVAAQWKSRPVVFVRQDATGAVAGAQPETVHVSSTCKAAIRAVEPKNGSVAPGG